MKYTARVLIVDDEQINRELLAALVEQLGYEFEEAADGHKALAKLNEGPFDVVLLDVMMSGMDGFQVLRRIRSTARWRDMPVILVTALADQESRIRGLEAGADDFLSKPVHGEELRARVQTTVELGRTRRQLQERAKFEWAVNQSSDGFLWVDEAGVCQFANPVALRWLETDQASLRRGNWLDHCTGTFTVRPSTSWPALCSTGRPFQLSLVRPETARHHALWLHLAGSPLPTSETNGPEWLLHMQDVTDREVHLRQAFSILDMVSHKLKTPLTVIRGSLEILDWALAANDGPDPAMWRDISETAKNGIDRLTRDADQLLAFADRLAEPAAQEVPDFPDGRAMGRLVRQVVTEVGLPAENCTVEIASERVPAISQAALELILRQLLENARKFHPQQTPQVKVTMRDEGADSVCIAVEDDGPGIPSELHDLVWQPLYQVDRWQTGEVAGVGVGLPLVASYVVGAGGDCRLESRAQQGTGVYLTLPAADDESGTGEKRSES